MTAPTILVVGATGNTGKAVVSTLSELLPNHPTLSKHRIVALTRSAKSQSAQALSKHAGVQVEEVSCPDITPEWLKERSVQRGFIASHIEPTHFADESTFIRAALDAGVQYLVRISTTAANVKPDSKAYYSCTHWAIEQLLSQPEYSDSMHWSSLQPNGFLPLILSPAVELIKQIRKTGKQESTLRLVPDEHVKVAPIDPDEVGTVAAHLLAQEGTGKYHRHKLVLNGPEDINGEDIVKMIEERVDGVQITDVSYKDITFFDAMLEHTLYSKHVMGTIKHAPATMWEGKCKAATTTQDVLDLAAPKRTPKQVLDNLLT